MSTRRPLARRLILAVGVAIAAVVGLAALLLVAVDSGVATRRAVDLVLPRVSAALGREVSLTGAKLRLFPDARVTLAGLTVAGRPGEPALVAAESLDVRVRLWPLLRSLGKEVDVRSFVLVRPSVSLVKARDGSWNFEGLGGPAAEGRDGDPPGRGRAPSPPAPSEEGARVEVALVKVEQAAIRLVDRSRGEDDPGLALTLLDLEARAVGPGLPLDARLTAALADTRQNLRAQLSLAKLPAALPQRPEDWPEVSGSLELAALALDRIHALLPGDLGAILRGGAASLGANVSTTRGGYRVEGQGELKDVLLRGQPAQGRFRAAATWSPSRPQAARVDLTDVALRGPGVELGGNASVETAPLRAWFVVTGPLLDLDAVMGILPESARPPETEPAAGAPGRGEGDVVPAAMRKEIQAANVRGTLAIEKVRGGRLEASDVKARVTLSRGTLVLDDMTAAVFGGRVSAAGTRVSLGEPVPEWKLVASLSGVDLETTLTAFAGHAPLLGKLDGRLEIDGRGTQWEKIRDGLTGLASLAVKDGTLTTTDLGDRILGGIAQGLEAVGRGGAAKAVGAAGGRTTFRDLAGKFTVKGGFLAAQAPLSFTSPVGEVTLGGRIGLGGQLALEGKAAVPRRVLAGVASGLPLPERLEVPLALGGSLSAPSVSVRADQAVASLVKGQARQVAEDVRGKGERAGRRAVEGILDRFKRR